MFASKMMLAACLTGALLIPAWAQDASQDQQSRSSKASHKSSKPAEKTADAAPGASNSMSRADQTFVEKAIAGGLAEVGLGKLAADKAADPQVKQFGERMVQEHTNAGQELNSLASAKGITPPSDLSAKDAAEKNKLSGLSGAEFDKAYMNYMVKDHEKDVAEFKKEANKSGDQDVKAAAQKLLPTLEDHLKQAKQIDSQVNGKAAGGGSNGTKSR